MAQSRGQALLRRAFRSFNHSIVLLWRLGLGGALNRGPRMAGRYLVLVHRGRRTGKRRLTPLNYAVVDGSVHCVAGFGPRSDWYRNVVADPSVQVWLPDGWWAGRAEVVTDPRARLGALRAVLLASGFAARLAGIDAARMTDEALSAKTGAYRVLRIERTAAMTGGPGDLAWVWPVLAVVLALAARRARARHRLE